MNVCNRAGFGRLGSVTGPDLIFTPDVPPDRARDDGSSARDDGSSARDDDDGWMKNGWMKKWVHNDNGWMKNGWMKKWVHNDN
jgi:hypothetical protein